METNRTLTLDLFRFSTVIRTYFLEKFNSSYDFLLTSLGNSALASFSEVC